MPLFIETFFLCASIKKKLSNWIGCFVASYIEMSINTTLLTQRTKTSLKQTSIISGNQAEKDLHMDHLEALYNLHANETGFYLEKNPIRRHRINTERPEEIAFTIRKCL